MSFLLSFSFGSSIIDIDKITQKAKLENKHIVVFFHMEYCPYCIKFNDKTLNDKKIKGKLQKDYIFVDINIDKEDTIIFKDFKGTQNQFSKSLNVSFFPTVLFVDSSKNIIYKLKGYKEAKTFNQVLDYITSKSYLKSDFNSYLFDLD